MEKNNMLNALLSSLTNIAARAIPLVTAATLAVMVTAQNLVPNPSFEEYTDCPHTFGYSDNVVGWTSPYTHSADYMNACADNDIAGVPYNTWAYQYPSDGIAYMGLFTYELGGSYYREFIATQLTSPLKPGVPVYLSFKTALGGFGLDPYNSANYTCRGVGMKFFNVLPEDWYQYIYPDYPNSAALYLQQAVTDTAVWVAVSGVYVPDSAYTQLVIGNFFSDSLNDPFVFDTSGYGLSNIAYNLIDQVCVSYDPNYCANWSGIRQLEGPTLTIGPNPFGATLHLHVENLADAPVKFRLFDALGRIVLNERWPAGYSEWTLDGSGLAPGYYTLLATNTQGASRSYALVHVSP
jgi:hypothetical protein